MNSNTPLNDKEQREISELLRAFSHRAHYNQELTALIKRWKSFVVNVKVGYTDSSYDYLNDLSVRDIVQSVIDSTTGDLKGKITELIKPWDDIFTTETSEIMVPLRKGKNKQYWWWYRIPLRMSSELKDELFF